MVVADSVEHQTTSEKLQGTLRRRLNKKVSFVEKPEEFFLQVEDAVSSHPIDAVSSHPVDVGSSHPVDAVSSHPVDAVSSHPVEDAVTSIRSFYGYTLSRTSRW
jgi:hypothetical protein